MDTLQSPRITTEYIPTPAPLSTHELALAVQFTGREYGRIAENEAYAWAALNEAEDNGAPREVINGLYDVACDLESKRIAAGHEWQNAKAALLANEN